MAQITQFPQQGIEKHSFKVSEKNSLKSVYIVLSFLLTVCILCTSLMLFVILPTLGKVLATIAIVVSVCIIAILIALGILLIVSVKLACKTITVSGRKLELSSKLRKIEYDCSDIVSIVCGVYRSREARICYVSIMFKDQRKYVLNKRHENALSFAKYLLDMNRIGVIASNVISPEDKAKLKLFAEGKRWFK